ncbi:MAG: amidohydrolase [Anaerolineaceae bacterium]|nr:amidohydrolase [Anaerolineaceae bacterium]
MSLMSKKPSLIDVDIHPVANRTRMLDFLAEPWRTRVARGNTGPSSLGYWNPNGVNRPDAITEDGQRVEANPQALAKHLFDLYDLEYGIFNPGGSLHAGLSPEPDFSAALVGAINDVFIHDWLPVDPRFRTSLVISPGDPNLAVEQIHKYGDHPGVVQVLMPSGSVFPYGHRYYHPIYEAAVAHDLPLAIHPGSEGNGVSGKSTSAGYAGGYFEWHTSLASNYIAHLVSLIAEGVFVKFPTMKFVLIEGGVSWVPSMLWRLDKNWKSLRMTVPWLDRPPSEFVADHIRLTTQPIEEPEDPAHLHAILDMFPVERMLMFSTDFPHWDGDTPDFSMRLLPKKLHSRVMSENARELYKLPVVEHA